MARLGRKRGMDPGTGQRRSQKAPAQEMGAGVRACLLTPESGVVVSEEPDAINRPGRVPEGGGRVQEGWRQLSRQVEVRGGRRRQNIEQVQGALSFSRPSLVRWGCSLKLGCWDSRSWSAGVR